MAISQLLNTIQQGNPDDLRLSDPTLPTAQAPQMPAIGASAPVQPQQGPLPTIQPVAQPGDIPQIRSFQPDPLRQRQEAALGQQLFSPRPQPHGFFGKAGHILNNIANAAGDVLIGDKMALIPGTILNQSARREAGLKELGQLRNEDLQDENLFDKQQTAQYDNELHQAQAREADARAKSLSGGEILYDKNGDAIGFHDGQGNFLTADDPRLPQDVSQIMAAARPKLPPEDQPLTNVDNLQKDLLDRYDVLHPSAALPAEYQLPANPTQRDYDRVDKALEGLERAESTKEQQAQTALLRQQAEEDRRANMALAQQKLTAADRKEIYTVYQPSMQSAERFNVMAENYEDAVKNHDQQAMLSLLANHLGMTMGLQKGARLNRDIINEAIQSRPWLQGIKTKFDSNGYLTGVTLTPIQMRQMVDLGRDRYREDAVNARNAASYMGATDDGPKRTPSAATIRFYIGLSGGDAAKAKQMAADDGWTVQ